MKQKTWEGAKTEYFPNSVSEDWHWFWNFWALGWFIFLSCCHNVLDSLIITSVVIRKHKASLRRHYFYFYWRSEKKGGVSISMLTAFHYTKLPFLMIAKMSSNITTFKSIKKSLSSAFEFCREKDTSNPWTFFCRLFSLFTAG